MLFRRPQVVQRGNVTRLRTALPTRNSEEPEIFSEQVSALAQRDRLKEGAHAAVRLGRGPERGQPVVGEELQAVDNSLPGMSSALPVLEDSLDPAKAESELLKERIMSLIDRDEEKAAGAFSLWLVRKDYQ